jgi:hypothetical protein
MTRKLNPSVFLTLDPVLDEGQLLWGSAADGYVYVMGDNISTDDGDVIEATWTTGWLDMGMPEITKMFSAVHVDTEVLDGPIDVTWSVDQGRSSKTMQLKHDPRQGGFWNGTPPTGTDLWDSTTKVWAGPPDIQKSRLVLSLPQEAEGQRIQLTFSGDLDFQITGYSIMYKVKEELAPQGGI